MYLYLSKYAISLTNSCLNSFFVDLVELKDVQKYCSDLKFFDISEIDLLYNLNLFKHQNKKRLVKQGIMVLWSNSLRIRSEV